MQISNHLIQNEEDDNQFLKSVAIILGVLIIAGLAIFTLGISFAKADTWNGWIDNFTICTNTTINSTPANYVIRDNVTWRSGMNANFSDLFFTTLDKSANISFYIFNYTDSQWAMVEINIPENITTDDYCFLGWYGDATLTTSKGNKTTTYVFADDFDRADNTSLGNNWTEYNSDWGIRTNRIESGTPNASYYSFALANGIGQFSNISIRSLMNISAWSKIDNAGGLLVRANENTGGTFYAYAMLLTNEATPSCALYSIDVASGNKSTASGWGLNQNWWFEIAVSGNSLYGKCWRENTTEPSNWTNVQTFTTQTTGYVGVHGMSTYDSTVKEFFSNFTVRRFYYYEPTVMNTYSPSPTPPQVVVSDPANGTNVSTLYLYINVTDLNTLTNCYLDWDNGSAINYTMILGGKYCFINISQIQNTSVFWKVYASNDSTMSWNVTKDMTTNFNDLQDYCKEGNISLIGTGQDALIKIIGNDLTLDDIWMCVGNTTLMKENATTWFLNGNISLVFPAELWINTTNYWLKINSTGNTTFHNITGNFRLMVTNHSKISSWNTETNTYDTGSYCDLTILGCPCPGAYDPGLTANNPDRRSAIAVFDSPLISEVTDSEVSYLGYGCGNIPYLQHMGLFFINTTPYLINNTFIGNRAIGLVNVNGSNASDNRIYNADGGFGYGSGSVPSPNSYNHIFINNSCWGMKETCIDVYQTKDMIIRGNNFSNDLYAIGLEGDKTSNITVEDNIFYSNPYALTASWGADNVIVKNNSFWSNTYNIYERSIFAYGNVDNYSFLNNSIQNSTYNIYIFDDYATNWAFNYGTILGATNNNIASQGSGTINATYNYWGDGATNDSIYNSFSNLSTIYWYPFFTIEGGYEIDITPPNIDWNTPINQSFTNNESWIYWNTSVSEVPDQCYLQVNASANVSMDYGSGYCTYNSTSLTNQTTYCGEVYVNDSSGNMNLSSVQCATINLTSTSANATIYECDSCSSCNITIASASEGDTVKLNTSINDYTTTCVVFGGKDNVTFDCQGNLIDGTDSGGYGIFVDTDANNNTIKNCRFSDFGEGIYIENNYYNKVMNISGFSGGNFYAHNTTYLETTDIITFSNSGISFYDENGKNNIHTNIVSNSSTYYTSAEVNVGNNVTIRNLRAISNSGVGLTVAVSRNCNFENLTVSSNGNTGISIETSSYKNNFINLLLESNINFGIATNSADSSNNTITNVIIINSSDGMRIGSPYNVITNVSISGSSNRGIYLSEYANYNVINNSQISNSTNYGLYFNNDTFGQYATDNRIYNNILNNTVNIGFSDAKDRNILNTTIITSLNIIGGSQIGGNYWAYPNGTGYSQMCINNNNDSFCDSAYALNTNNTDFLPLTLNTGETTPPNIIIISPQNISYNIINIALDVSANEAIDTWRYSLNGGTNTTFIPNTTITGAQGSNTLTVYANDSVGNTGSSTISFFVDSIAPTITSYSPINTTYNILNIDLQVSASEATDTWWYSLNGDTNTTFIPNTTIISSQGDNNVRIWANDTVGNLGESSVIYFFVDSIPPTITIDSPQNITYISVSQADLNVSADETIGTWWYSINGGSNTTFIPNTTINIANGSNILFIYANDTIGNIGQSFIAFTANYPTVTVLDSPNDGNATLSSVPINMTFICSATDESSLANISLYFGSGSIGWHLNETQDITGISNSSTFIKILPIGNYTWSCYSCDSGDQCSWAVPNRTLSITAPTPVRASLIGNLGQFGFIAGIAIGAGILMFLIDAFFGSVTEMLRDPKKLIVIIIGVIIMVAIFSVLF
jgi:parallel beta-helix repeat protein